MKTLLIIDSHALIHRLFHALPPLTTKDGQPAGALYGLASTMLKIFREEPPDYVAAAFDRPEPTFRKQLFDEYKIQRPKASDELVYQIVKSRELIEDFGISIFEKPGFEADDLIGALTEKFKKEKDLRIMIMTGDLDTLQLVEDDKVVVKTLKKGISETVIYNESAVRERYGLPPSLLTDYKGLVGDASDNIPGVSGIGPKTATYLINKFGSLEEIYKKIDSKNEKLIDKDRKIFEKLIKHKKTALLAKKLATIDRAAPIAASLNNLKYDKLPSDRLKEVFEGLGFQSLIKRLPSEEAVKEGVLPERFGFNFKEALKSGKKIQEPFLDIGIAAWLVDSSLKDYSPEVLTKVFLKKDFIESPELVRSLAKFLSAKLKEYNLEKLYYEMEMPLIGILAEMEKRGIKVDSSIFKNLKKEIDLVIEKLEKEIYKETGEVFNLNSPKQVLETLNKRYKLKLKSTGAEKLEVIKESCPAASLILQYREHFKIKSTYVEPLTRLVSEDGRLRTTFNQTGTATGRLSSSDPNLQNIPQVSEWTPKLRSAFLADEGFKLASFDYSQIELRILASVSGDKKLKEAFLEDQDIHKLTASQVFNLPIEKVTAEMRRVAKTLNFGVVYGMGSDAFAKQSGLKKDEAKRFIEEYFSDFPGVKKWQEEVKQQARTFGFITNLNGRRRWLFEIQSFNPRLRSEAERAAVNMPVQSLSADIIKLAMIKTDELIKKRGWVSEVRLLLSIHDELIFEISEKALKEAIIEIQKVMESVFQLTVPLRVDFAVGSNWSELK